MVAQVGTWEWDFDTDTLVPDEHFAHLIGLDKGLFIGLPRMDFAAMIHPDDRQQLGTAANTAIARGGSFDCSYRIVTASGKIHHILARGVSELAPDGQPGSFRGAIVDLTERHETEAALRANEERLAIAQRAGSIGTFEWNILSQQLLLTPEFEALYGLPAGAAQNRYENLSGLIYDEDREGAEQSIVKAIAGGPAINVEYRIRRPDGELRWMLMRGNVYTDDSGQPTHVVGVNVDITERKLLERQKDDFISIASHELNTPLTSTKAYAQLMRRRFIARGDEAAAENMTRINSQLDKLSNLVGDLLDVSRIETGKLKLRLTDFSVDDMVQEAVQHTQFTSETHSIAIHGECDCFITSDRERIEQVMANLLGNAIKYSPQSSEIDLHVRETGDGVEIKVRDYGIGVDVNQQESIFGRFTRAENAKRDAFPGLGLGLYISAEIVARLGGRLTVEQPDGPGTLFKLWLPLHQKGQNTA